MFRGIFTILLLCLFSSTQMSGQKLPYADIHLHSGQKPFNSRFVTSMNLWEKVEHDCNSKVSNSFLKLFSNVPRFSQANLEALAKGDVRVVCQVISPITSNFFGAGGLSEKNSRATISCVTGFVASQQLIGKQNRDYFNEVVENIKLWESAEEETFSILNREYSYKLVKTGADFDEILKDRTKIGVILGIEGGHALGSSLYIDNNITGGEEYAKYVLKNVDRLKGIEPLVDGGQDFMEYPILYLTLNNDFWNGFSGQCQTLSADAQEIFGPTKGVDEGLTPVGVRVIKRLTQIERGKRILIDVSNMPLEGRKWYYDYLKQMRYDKDTIPAIASNVGISGLNWKDENYISEDIESKNQESLLNNWKKSLSRQDVQNIVKSGGIIGLSMDRYVLAGDRFTREIEKRVQGSAERKKILVKLLVANICKVIHVSQNPYAWDCISIGSNFDGIMSPLDNYATSGDFPSLAKDLTEYFEDPEDLFDLYSAEQVRQFMYGLSAEEIVEKVMSKNAIDFVIANLGKSSPEENTANE